jgi:hypothetical protein
MKNEYMGVLGKRFFIHSSYHQSFFTKKGQRRKNRPHLSVCLSMCPQISASD